MKRRLITIYRSPRVAEMYLYVDRAEGLKRVPEVLLQRFGRPEQVSMMLLTPERQLARVSAVDVLVQIERVGFFLQLPPPPIERVWGTPSPLVAAADEHFAGQAVVAGRCGAHPAGSAGYFGGLSGSAD